MNHGTGPAAIGAALEHLAGCRAAWVARRGRTRRRPRHSRCQALPPSTWVRCLPSRRLALGTACTKTNSPDGHYH